MYNARESIIQVAKSLPDTSMPRTSRPNRMRIADCKGHKAGTSETTAASELSKFFPNPVAIR